MAPVIDIPKFDVEVSVPFSRSDRRVAKELLECSQVHPPSKQMSGERMPQDMRMEAGHGNARLVSPLPDDAPDVLSPQGPAGT